MDAMTNYVGKRIRHDPPYAATAALLNQVLVRLWPECVRTDLAAGHHAVRVHWFALPGDDVAEALRRELQ